MLWVHLIPRRLVGYVFAGGHSDSIDTKCTGFTVAGQCWIFTNLSPLLQATVPRLNQDFYYIGLWGRWGDGGCGSVGVWGRGSAGD